MQGSGSGFRYLALTYASLTEIDEQGNARPGLARSWDYNAKGDEITFHLRPNLKFTDGTPVNAEAVKLYLERAKTQPNSALDGDLTSIASVSVAGELDVVLHLTQVDHQVPLLLGQRVAQITSPTAARDPKALNARPVGAGPFKVVELYTPLKLNPFARKTDINSPEGDRMPSWGVQNRADYRFDNNVTFTSITAYRQWKWLPKFDGDQFGADVASVGIVETHQHATRTRPHSTWCRI